MISLVVLRSLCGYVWVNAPPGVVAYSITSTGISFFVAQQDIKTQLFEL